LRTYDIRALEIKKKSVINLKLKSGGQYAKSGHQISLTELLSDVYISYLYFITIFRNLRENYIKLGCFASL
jgi:hypothetical protein